MFVPSTGACAAGRYGAERETDFYCSAERIEVECAANEFVDGTENECMACPGNSLAPPGSASLDACMCAPDGEHRYLFSTSSSAAGVEGQCVSCPQRTSTHTPSLLLTQLPLVTTVSNFLTPRSTAGARCLNGECQAGTTGKGCASCDEGYFTAGTTCQLCPESLALMIPVAIAALVGLGLLVYLIWKASSVNITSTDVGEKESLAAAEEANDAVSAAVGVGSSIARISNTALISSISLPAIFQISLTFEMPFAYVAQHATNDVAFR